MGLAQNLMLAEFAVKHVEEVVSKGPGAFNQDFSIYQRVIKDIVSGALVDPAYQRLPPPPPMKPSGVLADLRSGLSQLWESAQEKADRLAREQTEQANRAAYDRAVTARTTTLDAEIQRRKQQTKQSRDAQSPGLLGPKYPFGPEKGAMIIGAKVERSGLGNCGEQSYVAFKYLVGKGASGLAVVDWGSLDGAKRTGNHTFVVIGMDPTVPPASVGSLRDPPDWGADAVVCDPWYHEWFSASDAAQWRAKMSRILASTQDDLGPMSPTLNKTVAEKQGRDKVAIYEHTLDAQWTFNRLAFLPAPDPGLPRWLAGMMPYIDRKGAELDIMRAHFRSREPADQNADDW